MQNNKDNSLHRQLANLFYSMSIDSLKDDIDNLEGIMKVWDEEVLPQMKKNLTQQERILYIINDDDYDWDNHTIEEILEYIKSGDYEEYWEKRGIG